MNKPLSSCPWCLGDELYQHYHDHEWGKPNHDKQRLFEFLILEGAQAGLAWITVLRKRENYYDAFDNFNIKAMAQWSKQDIEQLMLNSGIIRNRRKLESAKRNAQAYLKLEASNTCFDDFLWQFVGHKQIQNRWKNINDVPSETAESHNMSKALKQAGFNFVGPTICYAFMQSVGMVNDHLISCPEYKRCLE